VEVIPGISAINSCASLLGAPVMHDACTISLSDHLTPWEVIAKRIEAAAAADFVIALYNPKSGRRTRQIVKTQQILLKYRSPETPVGLVKSAYRQRQNIVITTLERMLKHEIGMLTTVIIGNSSTFVYEGRMITPRGYQRKYTLDQTVQPLKPHERLQVEAEPWSLNALEETRKEDRAKDREAKALAEEALTLLAADGSGSPEGLPGRASIFEVAVSPGLANKKFTPTQLACLADIAGEQGEIEYTPHHRILLRVFAKKPEQIVERLAEAGFLLEPVGDVVQLKACDFCDGDKAEAIPQLEELQRKIGGMAVPKELKIGFNGCAMACYGAVTEEIGIVYRRGAFDLFLGGKKIGRNAQVAERVAEGLSAEELLHAVERVVREYKDKAHPNERFHKFFKRVKEVAGFRHTGNIQPIVPESACGD
jgi:precorrin-3B C17-methyltransferase